MIANQTPCALRPIPAAELAAMDREMAEMEDEAPAAPPRRAPALATRPAAAHAQHTAPAPRAAAAAVAAAAAPRAAAPTAAAAPHTATPAVALPVDDIVVQDIADDQVGGSVGLGFD
jgi:hypothetical protein